MTRIKESEDHVEYENRAEEGVVQLSLIKFQRSLNDSVTKCRYG